MACGNRPHHSLNHSNNTPDTAWLYQESLSTHLVQHYLQLRITIMHIYIIPGIRQTNHTIALYDNIILSPLSPSTRDKLPNVPRHRRSRHQSWRELCNDTRLLDNPNPPTVDHNYKTHIPDTVNHNYIYITCPIVTLPPPPSTNVLTFPDKGH